MAYPYTEKQIRQAMSGIKQDIIKAGTYYRFGGPRDRGLIFCYLRNSAHLYYDWWKLLKRKRSRIR